MRRTYLTDLTYALDPSRTAETRRCLEALERARGYSADLGCDPSEFAVSMSDLRRLGVIAIDVLWLLRKGWILGRDSRGRLVEAAAVATERLIEERWSFVLSEAGHRQLAPSAVRHEWQAACQAIRVPPSVVPKWDPQLRELSYQGLIVKRFRVPAVNQERVLTVFEEEGWPPAVDDPLPADVHVDAHQRLLSTLKSLNRNQCQPLLRFRGNGNGQEILWEPRVAILRVPESSPK